MRTARLPLQSLSEYTFPCFRGARDRPSADTNLPPDRTNKKGYEEVVDFFRVKNPNGTPALCHGCNKAAAEDKPLIPCSVPNCGLNWHLECLDPPLAVPPPPRSWRCPCHVEGLLHANLPPSRKYRKVKNARVIEPIYSRGMANNGFIEIESESEDDENNEDAWKHDKGYGRIFRLHERGIKLDFISRYVFNSNARATLPGR